MFQEGIFCQELFEPRVHRQRQLIVLKTECSGAGRGGQYRVQSRAGLRCAAGHLKVGHGELRVRGLRVQHALQSRFGAIAHIGFGGSAANECDAPMPQRDEVFDGRAGGGTIINAYAGVEPVRGGDVNADDRHMHMLEALHLGRLDVERADDYRICIAAHGQVRKEIVTLFGVAHGVGHGVIAGRAQHRVEPCKDVRIEPGGDGLAGQQRDAERLAGLQRGGRSGNGVVELLGGGHYLVAGFGEHQVRLGERAGHCGYGNAGLLGHRLNACFGHIEYPPVIVAPL